MAVVGDSNWCFWDSGFCNGDLFNRGGFLREGKRNLSDVVVRAFDQKDEKILLTVAIGQQLYIDLPSEVYHLEANFKGDMKRACQIKIGKKTPKGHFRSMEKEWRYGKKFICYEILKREA